MSSLLPIVSLAGSPELHERARQFNEGLARLRHIEDDLARAIHWNLRERFGSGFFARTRPPVDTGYLCVLRDATRAVLIEEQAALQRAANDYLARTLYLAAETAAAQVLALPYPQTPDPYTHPEQENA